MKAYCDRLSNLVTRFLFSVLSYSSGKSVSANYIIPIGHQKSMDGQYKKTRKSTFGNRPTAIIFTMYNTNIFTFPMKREIMAKTQ